MPQINKEHLSTSPHLTSSHLIERGGPLRSAGYGYICAMGKKNGREGSVGDQDQSCVYRLVTYPVCSLDIIFSLFFAFLHCLVLPFPDPPPPNIPAKQQNSEKQQLYPFLELIYFALLLDYTTFVSQIRRGFEKAKKGFRSFGVDVDMIIWMRLEMWGSE